MIRKNLLVVTTAILCLTISLFMIKPTISQSTREYDPWYDINDDGKIDIKDVYGIELKYGTTGTPINKTQIILDLQARIDALNNTLTELQSRIDNMYGVTIRAHCNLENADVDINITKDGLVSNFTSSHTFTLIGPHNFTVPSIDLNGDPFIQWNTGSSDTTINVTSNGEYIAYYFGQVNVNETIVTPDTISVGDTGSFNWGPIRAGETRSVILYLRNKSLPRQMIGLSWSTGGSLPSYLHMTGLWYNGISFNENQVINGWTPDWYGSNTPLKFTLTADNNTPVGSVSFVQTFSLW